MRDFKFFKGIMPPKRYYGSSRGSLNWISGVFFILYYLEEDDTRNEPYITLDIKSQNLTLHEQRYNSFNEFMDTNHENLIFIKYVTDEMGNEYTQKNINLLDLSSPVNIMHSSIVINPYDKTGREDVLNPILINKKI